MYSLNTYTLTKFFNFNIFRLLFILQLFVKFFNSWANLLNSFCFSVSNKKWKKKYKNYHFTWNKNIFYNSVNKQDIIKTKLNLLFFPLFIHVHIKFHNAPWNNNACVLQVLIHPLRSRSFYYNGWNIYTNFFANFKFILKILWQQL